MGNTNSGTRLYSIGRRNKLSEYTKNYQLYLLLALPITYILIFKYWPMYGALIAFKNFKPLLGIMGSPWVGFKYFVKFFESYQFSRVVWNSLGISLYSLAVGFPVPIILALMINNFEGLRYKKFMQMVIYAPNFISTVVIVGMLLQFLSTKGGLINNLIGLFGISPVQFMSEPRYFWSIYVLSGVWQSAGWGTIIYIAALASVDPSLYEAAVIDGASKLKRTFYIDVPSIMPVAVIVLILSAGSILNVGFEKVFLMQNSLNLSASEVIQTYVYKVSIASGMPDYPYGTAIGLMNSVVSFIMIVLVNAISRKFNQTSLF